MLKFHARTDVGLKRKHNEDSLLALEEYGLFVVADGVGGRKAGELASAITMDTFQKFAPSIKQGVETFAAEPTRETRNAVLALIDKAANFASRRVYETAQNTGRQGMTTTLVCIAVGGGGAFIGHVGDSRGYLVRDGQLRQITEDHSMVNELIRTGALQPEEAAKSQYRNVITRAVGLYPTVKTDTLHIDLVDGDRLMLCSDGLHDMMTPGAMLRHAQHANIVSAVDALIQQALEGGGKDNITCVLVEPEATLEAEAVAARARAMENLFLFRDLPFQARQRVGRIVNEVFTTPNQRIVTRGEIGESLYVVVQGQMSVHVEGKEIAVLKEGDHFGELSLIDGEPRSADVIAKGFGHLLCVEREAFREFCVMEPTLGNMMLWKLVATLGQRLRVSNERIIKG
jgi:serine/threonine protein phosphatase PrpC